MTQIVTSEWIKTDEIQWVLRKSEDRFQVIDITLLPETGCLVTDMEVDLNIFLDEDLDHEVQGYYKNLEEVKSKYGSDWKQIVAEIIAEQNGIGRVWFSDEEAAIIHLRYKYNHSFETDSVPADIEGMSELDIDLLREESMANLTSPTMSKVAKTMLRLLDELEKKNQEIAVLKRESR